VRERKGTRRERGGEGVWEGKWGGKNIRMSRNKDLT